jgi:hypothetical protein
MWFIWRTWVTLCVYICKYFIWKTTCVVFYVLYKKHPRLEMRYRALIYVSKNSSSMAYGRLVCPTRSESARHFDNCKEKSREILDWLINKGIITWCFSYWPSYWSSVCCIGVRLRLRPSSSMAYGRLVCHKEKGGLLRGLSQFVF